MKYVIEKNNSDLKLIYHNIEIDGLEVNPVNNVKKVNIKSEQITLVDSKLRENYIKKRINNKINKVIEFMLRILEDETTTDEDAGMVLDEINRLKGIIIKKYKNYMLESEYKALLTKLIILEDEFKKSYNQKLLMNYPLYNIYENFINEGRQR